MTGKLVEATHVSLGGEIRALDTWASPYLDAEHSEYASRLLAAADALLLGRVTYEGLSTAYTRMADDDGFVARMNAIPKHVASTTLSELSWNATVIEGPVAARVAELKSAGAGLLKYGNGELDETLMEHGLIDEFHLFLTPAAVGRGTHLFERLEGVQHLDLVDVARFESGVLVAVYRPK